MSQAKAQLPRVLGMAYEDQATQHCKGSTGEQGNDTRDGWQV